jgi:hypothetical protein
MMISDIYIYIISIHNDSYLEKISPGGLLVSLLCLSGSDRFGIFGLID